MYERVIWVMSVWLGLSASVALAQRPLDERRPATADGTVKVTNALGMVRVTGWDRDTVAVGGVLGRGAERLELSGEGRETRIRVVVPRDARELHGTTLDVRVPRRSHVAVRSAAADIEVVDVNGALDLESVSGGITVTGQPRMVYAESAGGDLLIDAASKVVRAKSVSGSVTVLQARGYLEVSTVSGQARVVGRRLWEGEVTSVSGNLSFEGGFDTGGSFYLESHSGTVELRLPPGLAADFDITSLSGGAVENEFASPGERTFSTGGGGTQIRIKSFKGKIRILKLR